MNVRLALVALAVTVAPAPAAHATEYCFGPPSQPLAYVCYTPSIGGAPEVREQGTTVLVPSVCYGVGCTGDKYVPVPDVYIHTGVQAGTLTVAGRSVPVGIGSTLDCGFDTTFIHCVS